MTLPFLIKERRDIMKWYVTGDTHGQFNRMKLLNSVCKNERVIILGDAGFNFYGNDIDKDLKRIIKNTIVYCVRGNHEMRPQDVPNMECLYDCDVEGEVYFQWEYPNIRYFKDYGEYTINGLSVLVVGGAYSIDKYHRLQNRPADTKEWTGWFANEQLSEAERKACFLITSGKHYDVVLTHTCPATWEPIELFLPFVDQSRVDKTMEEWFDELRKNISFDAWLFGHYHGDKYIDLRGRMFYKDILDLNETVEDLRSHEGY